MNEYKKLFFILALSAHSLHFYANTNLPTQEEVDQTDLQLNYDENALKKFVEQAYDDQDLTDNIIESYAAKVAQSQHLTQIKKHVIDPRHQQSIQDVEIHVSKQKKSLKDIYLFLSKEELTLQDIKDFAPQFAQFKYMFLRQDSIQIKHATRQEHNFLLLSRLQQIEEKRSKKNFGNLIRNTDFGLIDRVLQQK